VVQAGAISPQALMESVLTKMANLGFNLFIFRSPAYFSGTALFP